MLDTAIQNTNFLGMRSQQVPKAIHTHAFTSREGTILFLRLANFWLAVDPFSTFMQNSRGEPPLRRAPQFPGKITLAQAETLMKHFYHQPFDAAAADNDKWPREKNRRAEIKIK